MPQNIACLFPGQGSQEPNMGRDLAEHWSDAMDLWKLAEKTSNLPLREIFWENDTEAMSKTNALQPALTVVNMSFWLFCRRNLRPVCTAGHSLGEFAALFAAEVLDHLAVLQAVSLRGRLMNEIGKKTPGGMLAIVKLNRQQVETIVQEVNSECDGEIRIANYNTPAQFVLSGNTSTLETAAQKAKSLRGRGIMLAVSGAFHTPLMQDASVEFNKFLQQLDWKAAKFPVILNVNAKAEQDPEIIKNNLFKQMTSSVLWEQSVQSMHRLGITDYLEIGPQSILNKMVKSILTESEPNFSCLCNLAQLTSHNPKGNDA